MDKITLLNPPPPEYAKFSVRGRTFSQKNDETFEARGASGLVDPRANSFLSRVYRYGAANGIPGSEWDDQAVYRSVSAGLGSKSVNYFRVVSSSAVPVSGFVDARADPPATHDAGFPEGLQQAVYTAHTPSTRSLGSVDATYMAKLTANEWYKALTTWTEQNPSLAKFKDKVGPVWWYALHSLAAGQAGGTTPDAFVRYWLGYLPCSECRDHFSVYLAGNPTPQDWTGMAAWASAAHDWVSENKNRYV